VGVRGSAVIFVGVLAMGAISVAGVDPVVGANRTKAGAGKSNSTNSATRKTGRNPAGLRALPITSTVSPPTKCGSGFEAARKRASSRGSRELAQSLFVVHTFGSSAIKVTPEQEKANLNLYGQKTPADIISTWKPAGIILIGRNAQDANNGTVPSNNIVSTEQLSALTSGLRLIDPKLIVSIDQEGGRVNRLRPIVGRIPSARTLTGDVEQLRATTAETATRLRALGINVDFAPDADVVPDAAPDDSIIGDRSFGSDPKVVSSRVNVVVKALQKAKVAAVAKHWPGHGSTLIDSHISTPVLDRTAADLESVDLVPFNAAIDSGVAGIMVGHLAVKDWDPSGLPASVSPKILGKLRNKYCVIDSMWVGGFRSVGSDADAALATLNAGADMLLMPVDLAKSIDKIESVAKTDPAVRARLVDAAARVSVMRDKYAIR
jgi:beta-N-acetylhexosaminidase